MNAFLENKVAVVTGGSRGIGFAICRALVQAGASVALCARNQQNLATAVTRLREETKHKIAGYPADVTSSTDVARLFAQVDAEFGGVDILVNNAGIGIFAPVAELTWEQWRAVIATNLDGVFLCCREAIPRMRNRGGGAIINISSLAGRNPFAGGAAYNASKFGLNGFSEAMMLDHRNENIRVTYIMPGSVNTDFGNSAAASWKMQPEDVAQAVMAVLAMPERTLISRIEMRPSKPPK
jgi:NAD(P)-dependent dehydrogenase (short-subunit alcohol dehydrogenase family)